jgi:pimeloyl-ACP methyl ester carboxylesterase
VSPFGRGHVEADGIRIRYLEAGQGLPLVYLPGADGLHLTPAHELLARRFRVVALEMPGVGPSPEHTPPASSPDLATTMAHAAAQLGLETFNLLGASVGGTTALWLALQRPERVSALVLEAPVAIRPDGVRSTSTPLAQRRDGLDRDPDLDRRLPELTAPTLVLFGTRDTVVAPEMGRQYTERMPAAHLVFLYDAGHTIAADRPEAFAEVVGDFLERHEAFVISRARTVIHP